MADLSPYGGLDPSLVSYLQGGAMPPSSSAVPESLSYGLPPSVVAGVQGGFSPQGEVQHTMPEYLPMTAVLDPHPVRIPAGPASAPSAPSAPPLPPSPVVPATPIGREAPRPMPPGTMPMVPFAGLPSPQRIGETSPTTGETAAAEVPSVTGGKIPEPEVPTTFTTTQRPDIQMGAASAPSTPAEIAAANKAYDRKRAADAAFAATPEGIAQKAETEQRAALEKERQATADASIAEQAQNDATAKALQAHAERQAKQDAIDAAKTAEDRANTDKYAQQYAQQIKDAANYKVDTTRHVGLGGMIAIALSGIGDALDHRHGPNAALQIIDGAMDKHIADQWAQKKSLGETASTTKDALDVYRRNADDDRQAMQFQRAAESTKLADDLRQVAAQSANPAVKARAEAAAAALDQKSSAITMDEAQRKAQAIRAQQEHANQQAQLAIAGGHLALARQDSERNFALKVAELEQKGETAGAKQAASAAKNLKDNGVYDPGTGNVLLSADAAPLVAQRKKLLAQAATATDPKIQASLQKQADDLRTTAQLQYGLTVEDKGGKLKGKMEGAQRLVNATQRIRDELDSGGLLDRDTRAKLKTEADNAFTAWAELNGVKASSREYQVYKDAIGQIDGYGATNMNKGPLKASLDALDTGTKVTTGAMLRSHGQRAIDENGNPWVPSAEKGTPATVVPGTTSAERGSNAQPGIVTKALGVDLRHPFTGPEERNPLNVENTGDLTPTGLTKADDDKVMGLVRSYGKVSPDENQRAVASLSALVSSPGDDERKQALASAVLGRVKENPKLYEQVLATLPESQRKEIQQFDASGLDPAVLGAINKGFKK